MIKPSIGRVVLVYRGEKHIGGQWNSASVIGVISDTEISVAGFDRNGDEFRQLNITLRQDEIASDATNIPWDKLTDREEPFACWMPYQRAVAK